MHNISLFTDGSVDTKSNIGFGACLFCKDIATSTTALKNEVKIKRFEETSSVKLEMQTLLWALEQIDSNADSITVYTDSQNIISLPSRRAKLEAADFHNKKNVALKHADLYKRFYTLTDTFNIEFIKVKGHKKSSDKNQVEQIFTLVDKASRQALRKSFE